jgi:hypothetical protein
MADFAPPPPNIPQSGIQSTNEAPAQNPAPSHEQTVTALRHFQTVGKSLFKLLKNPDLGKANLKSTIIDATSKLVADSILQPSQAVGLLVQMPEEPFKQKQWLQNMYAQSIQAQVAVLQHHRQGNPGSGNLAQEMALHNDTSNQHMDVMQNMLSSHYGGR